MPSARYLIAEGKRLREQEDCICRAPMHDLAAVIEAARMEAKAQMRGITASAGCPSKGLGTRGRAVL